MSQTVTQNIRYPEKMSFAPRSKEGMFVLTVIRGNEPPNLDKMSVQFQRIHRKLTSKDKQVEFKFQPEGDQPSVIYQVECIHDGA